MSEYVDLAQRALHIMGIEFTKDEPLEVLVQKIRFAMLLPASQTEREIASLSTQIGSEIEEKGEVGFINDLLAKLYHEVTFLSFD